MFNLKTNLGQWRKTMSKAIDCPPEMLDELESHLCDHFETLSKAGHTEPAAWEQAVARMGNAEQVAAEFAKEAESARTVWLPVRVLTWLAIAGVFLMALLVLSKFDLSKMNLLLTVHVFTVTVGYSALCFSGFLAACYVLGRQFRSLNLSQFRSLLRGVAWFSGVAAIATTVGIGLGCFWAKGHLGRYWAWDLKEIGATMVLGWSGLIWLVQSRGWAQSYSILQACCLGNIVVIVAWLGPAMHQGHDYGFASPLGMILWTLIVVHLLFFGFGFLPPVFLRKGMNRA